jgi:2-keto-3-deoxy-L-rhamnonate aldolase RhmA
MANKLIEKMRNGEAVPGIWINSVDPQITEIAVTYGAEWILIDREHEPIDRAHLTAMLMACKGTKCQPIVRAPENRDGCYKWVLDLGAAGVLVPKVKTLSQAAAAVRYGKYRPLGERGVGPMRAANYYADPGYRRRANEDTVLMLQIEEADILPDIEAVARLPGLDALFIGPADLSDALGVFGQFEHPKFVEAIDLITRTCREAGMPVCMPAFSPELQRSYYEKGVRGFLVVSDYRLMINGVKSAIDSATARLRSES